MTDRADTTDLADGGRIHHLALHAEWQAALRGDGQYRRSTIDRTLDQEGFIHCSFPAQVQATADRYYRDRGDVVLLTIVPTLLHADVRVENTHGGAELFPHVYGPIGIDAVVAARPVELNDDGTLDVAGALG